MFILMRPVHLLLLGLVLVFLANLGTCTSQRAQQPLFSPQKNMFSKWRIGYVESMTYPSYQLSLLATVRGLMTLGWVKTVPLPTLPDKSDTRYLWRWLSSELESDYIEFVPGAYWTFAGDKEKGSEVRGLVIDELNRGRLDLLIVMGTVAGKSIGATSDHQVPTIVMSTTDPLSANIIQAVDDSGFDHLHARVDPYRHQQQVRVFHDLFNFERLGVVYENTPAGRSFAGIDSVEEIANLRGFELVTCEAEHAQFVEDSTANVLACHEELADKIDALYLTRHPGVTSKTIPVLLEPLQAFKIPTFSQSASDTVKAGVLIGTALGDLKEVGLFYAKTIAQVFHGKKPRDLPQLFRSPPRFALNLSTAEEIAYTPPVEILSAVAELYQTEKKEN